MLKHSNIITYRFCVCTRNNLQLKILVFSTADYYVYIHSHSKFSDKREDLPFLGRFF